MSYRSFKHVLGETNLERKVRFLFGICLLALITGSFLWYGRKTEALVQEKNQERGRLLVSTALTMHHFERLFNEEADTAVDEEFARTFINPFVEDLRNQEYEWTFFKRDDVAKLSGPLGNALRELFDTQPPGAGEAAARVAFEENYAGSGEYEYFQPVYAHARCVDCHNLLGDYDLHLGGADPSVVAAPPTRPALLEDGDVMAIAKVSFANEPTLQALKWNRAQLLATAIVTVFLAMLASYAIIRYVIVKPLKHLRETSDAVSRGETSQRADIHTGDEFESLGQAFNRMLAHLVDAQEELRHLNRNLDLKVDELAQMNMRLFEMNRLKSDFLATMSHELRTPLNSILGFSDVLGAIESLDERQKRYVQNIQKSGKVLLDMINDILDLAKIEAGRADVRLSDFRIGPVVAAQCDMARPLSERKNIDLDVRVAGNLPELHQDQGKIQQVLNNLLSNAIKFTPEGGRIVVTARRDDAGRLELAVADTGVGIAPEDRQQIFEKFRQGTVVLPAGDAMTREFSGTGLGLSIVKELCKLLGGEVALESELGKGSTFTVRLPWSLADARLTDSMLTDSADALARPRMAEFDGGVAREPAPAAAQ
jgi:signal transduction histidine kinase